MVHTVKNLPAKQETRVWSLGQEDPLEKGMATQYCCLETSMGREARQGSKESDMTEWLTVSLSFTMVISTDIDQSIPCTRDYARPSFNLHINLMKYHHPVHLTNERMVVSRSICSKSHTWGWEEVEVIRDLSYSQNSASPGTRKTRQQRLHHERVKPCGCGSD